MTNFTVTKKNKEANMTIKVSSMREDDELLYDSLIPERTLNKALAALKPGQGFSA